MAQAKGAIKERPTPLGDRVYKKHRKMLAEIAKKLRVSVAEATRLSIETMYVSTTTTN